MTRRLTRCALAAALVTTFASCKTKSVPLPALTDASTDSESTFVSELPPRTGSAKHVRTARAWRTNYDFDQSTLYETLSGAHTVNVTDDADLPRWDGVLEVSVEEGTVRGYLAVMPVEKKRVRKPGDQGYRYVEATPGHPARLTGELFGAGSFVLESVGGTAKGVRCRMSR